jgi:integrase
MASIWRHPKSKYFTACFTDHTGRQVKRSTKKTDRDEAMTIALEYERAERSARDGVLTEAQCRRVLSDILERTTGDHIRHVTVEDFFRDWLASKEAAKADGTAARYKNTVELFLAHIGKRAQRPLTGIMPRDIQTFLNARLKAGRASKTVIVDAKTLGAAFNRGRRQGVISSNPVEAVDLPTLDSSERDVFTIGQVRLLIDAAQGDWKTIILLGYFTGARLGDCANMQWSNVNLTDGVLSYQPEKTKTSKQKKVIVPLHPDLEEHLSKLAASDTPETLLCPNLAGKTSGGAHGLSQTFKALMRQAGIDTQTGKGKGERQFSALTFHSLRHSFNSALANAGVDQELRMKLTGHKTIEVNAGYTHHELAPLKQAINKLPKLLAGNPK